MSGKMSNVLIPSFISIGTNGKNSDLEQWIKTNYQSFSASVCGEIFYFKSSDISRYFSGELYRVFKRVQPSAEEDNQSLFPRVCLAGFLRSQ